MKLVHTSCFSASGSWEAEQGIRFSYCCFLLAIFYPKDFRSRSGPVVKDEKKDSWALPLQSLIGEKSISSDSSSESLNCIWKMRSSCCWGVLATVEPSYHFYQAYRMATGTAVIHGRLFYSFWNLDSADS